MAIPAASRTTPARISPDRSGPVWGSSGGRDRLADGLPDGDGLGGLDGRGVGVQVA